MDGGGGSSAARRVEVSCTLLTRAAISASCVPMKFVTSTVAYSHLRRGNVMLILICGAGRRGAVGKHRAGEMHWKDLEVVVGH